MRFAQCADGGEGIVLTVCCGNISRRMEKLELEKRKAPMENNGVQTDNLVLLTDIANQAIHQQESALSVPLSHSPGKAYRIIKRCFDFLSSMVVSIILLPLLLILMVLIMIKDPGNPLYFQKRVGKGGRPIFVAKLRSMRKDADHLEEMLTPDQLAEYHHEYKLKDDPRLIGWKKPGDGRKCFGAKLRQWSLDEVLQIPYNVLLKGNMSLVGPRPIIESELLENYTPAQQRILLSVKPGLTGYWQAYARNNAMYEDGKRQRMELYYVQNRSLWLDVKILFATVKAVLKKSGM